MMKEGNVFLGRYINEVRLERGLSQDDVARAVGANQSDISRCERGQYVRKMHEPEMVEKLYKLLGGDYIRVLQYSRTCPVCRGGGRLREWKD